MEIKPLRLRNLYTLTQKSDKRTSKEESVLSRDLIENFYVENGLLFWKTKKNTHIIAYGKITPIMGKQISSYVV